MEVHAEGEKQQLEKLIECLKVGPAAARVDRVVTRWSDYTGSYEGFRTGY